MERVQHLENSFGHVLFDGDAGAERASVFGGIKNNCCQVALLTTFVQRVDNLAHHGNVQHIQRRPRERDARNAIFNIELNILELARHSLQCTLPKYCGSNSFGSSGTSARSSEYSSVVTTLPSTMKITSGDIQPPPSFTYLLNCVSCVCGPSFPTGRSMRTKYRFFRSIQNCGE